MLHPPPPVTPCPIETPAKVRLRGCQHSIQQERREGSSRLATPPNGWLPWSGCHDGSMSGMLAIRSDPTGRDTGEDTEASREKHRPRRVHHQKMAPLPPPLGRGRHICVGGAEEDSAQTASTVQLHLAGVCSGRHRCQQVHPISLQPSKALPSPPVDAADVAGPFPHRRDLPGTVRAMPLNGARQSSRRQRPQWP